MHNNLGYLNRLLKNVNIEKINSMLETKSMLIGKDKQEIDKANLKSKNIYLLSAIGDNRGFKKTVEKIGANIVGHSKFLIIINLKLVTCKKCKMMQKNLAQTISSQLKKIW